MPQTSPSTPALIAQRQDFLRTFVILTYVLRLALIALMSYVRGHSLQEAGTVASGLIVQLCEEEATWPPWKWTEEYKKSQQEGGKMSLQRVHFADTFLHDVSVVKVALCNRSRKDALISIQPKTNTNAKSSFPSSFRLRHRQVFHAAAATACIYSTRQLCLCIFLRSSAPVQVFQADYASVAMLLKP